MSPYHTGNKTPRGLSPGSTGEYKEDIQFTHLCAQNYTSYPFRDGDLKKKKKLFGEIMYIVGRALFRHLLIELQQKHGKPHATISVLSILGSNQLSEQT